MTQVDPDAVKLFYDESKSAADGLDATFKQYRTNTTVVLALATGAATFFGFADSPKGFWFVAAVVAYGLAAIIAASIFLPADWSVNPAADMYAEITTSPTPLEVTNAYLDLGQAHQEAFEFNLKTITGWSGVAGRFRIMICLTAAVMVCALINVSQHQNPSPAKPTRIIIERGHRGPV